MEGFKSVLEAMERSFGALDEPAPGSNVVVSLGEREKRCDAIGIDDDIVITFSWETVSKEEIAEFIDEHDIDPEFANEEFDADDPFMMIESIVPLGNVEYIDIEQSLF